MSVRSCLIALTTLLPFCAFAQVTVPVVVATNVTIRVMASNLSSGNYQRYETAGIDILKGLKPDIVAMQEFNYASTNGLGTNTQGALREMIDSAFGTNFYYFREPGAYNIPNGIVSRYPFLSTGTWASDVGDRGYAWVQIDLPGTNDLYVVSVHLKASSSSATQRSSEATVLKSDILANFPTNAWIVVAGDMNLYSDTEAAIQTFKTFLSDSPVPADQANDSDTNAGRSERYDRVLPSFSMTNLLVPLVMPSRTYTNGLVFDSGVYTSLTDVPPVQFGDSHVTGMQHMAVVKAFKVAYSLTNFITVTSPPLSLITTNVIRWPGASNMTYTVQESSTLTNWATAGTVTSTTTNFGFTNIGVNTNQLFYRVTYP